MLHWCSEQQCWRTHRRTFGSSIPNNLHCCQNRRRSFGHPDRRALSRLHCCSFQDVGILLLFGGLHIIQDGSTSFKSLANPSRNKSHLFFALGHRLLLFHTTSTTFGNRGGLWDCPQLPLGWVIRDKLSFWEYSQNHTVDIYIYKKNHKFPS